MSDSDMSDVMMEQNLAEPQDLAENEALAADQNSAENQDYPEDKDLAESQDLQMEQNLAKVQEQAAEQDLVEDRDLLVDQEVGEELPVTQGLSEDKNISQEYPEKQADPLEKDAPKDKEISQRENSLKDQDDDLPRYDDLVMDTLRDLPHDEYLEKNLSTTDFPGKGSPEPIKSPKECLENDSLGKASNCSPPVKAVRHPRFKLLTNKSWNGDPKIDYKAPLSKLAGKKRDYDVPSRHLTAYKEKSEKGKLLNSRVCPPSRCRPIWTSAYLHPKRRPEPCKPLKPVQEPTRYQDVRARYLDCYKKDNLDESLYVSHYQNQYDAHYGAQYDDQYDIGYEEEYEPQYEPEMGLL